MQNRRDLKLPGHQVLPDRQRAVWPNGGRMAVILTLDCYSSEAVSFHHMLASSLDFGVNAGARDLAALFASLGISVTCNISGATVRAHPRIAAELAGFGHEIGVLGDRYVPHHGFSAEDERDAILAARDAVAAATGQVPRGWKTPQSRPTVETLPLLVQEGFLWDSSLRNDDVPYRIDFTEGSLIEIPAGGPGDDSGYVGFPAPITPPAHVLSVWRDEFDQLYEESVETGLNMLVLTISPSFMGRRVGLGLLRELIHHIKTFDEVWFGTCGAVTDWAQQNDAWMQEHAQ